MTDLSIIPFGGVRENGKNMYAITIDDDIYLLDAGLKYPETDLLGVDVVVPDFNYLVENANRVVGVFLTHGHADAIGALPYFLQQVPVPVFGSELTIELVKEAVKAQKTLKDFDDYHVVDPTSVVDFGKTKVSFFSTTHSIPESLGIVLESPYGQLVYTGDFKFDQTARGDYETNLLRLAEIGKKGVLALLADVNGTEMPGATVSESSIGEYIEDLFKDNKDRRIVVAMIASNVLRLQQIINAAYLTGRKIALGGNDVESVLKTAVRMGKIILPVEQKELFTDIRNAKSLEPNKTVVISAGKMGEPIRHLQRMASGEDRFVQINEHDIVFIATTPSIPAEGIMARTRDALFRRGALVRSIREDLKSSGHATQADLQLMLNFMKPSYFFPVSGEYRVMTSADYLAQEVGIPKENIFLSMKGDQYKLKDNKFVLEDSFEIADTMIDGSGIQDVGNVVLRDRKILSEDGVFVIVMTIDRKKKKIITRPKMNSRGFVFVKTSRDLMIEASKVAVTQTEEYLEKTKDFDWNDLKNGIRDAVARFLFEQTKRRPVVMAVVMEVNQNRRPNNNSRQKNNAKKKNETPTEKK